MKLDAGVSGVRKSKSALLAHGGCKEVFATKSPCPTAGAARNKIKDKNKLKTERRIIKIGIIIKG
ncbi:TPA: hypothetical protein DEO28_00950 [Candidatus Dependentiae bacterium]|nr:hypothetical protein [Candidatus Dependentiae bacterium]HBZ73067.1 hypothetical protein [Candidatus Dependentiae bacterium]